MDSERSMDNIFIEKVNSIIEANLENEHFGVKELAGSIAMSSSQLYRKLTALTGKSTSQFIREYRLKKAMEMLQNNVATASEIAYRVGFNSPTYFNTCFSEYYGFPPGEVKIRVASKISEENQASIKEKTLRTPQEKEKSRKKMTLIFSLIVLIFIIISFITYSYVTENVKAEKEEIPTNEKSIAILPFKNLSDNKDNQFFANGVMEAIQNNLNKIADLRVISETTMKQYSENTKTAPEIAEELNISHLLEASVQLYEDKVRIITKLIDAKNDMHIWSETYDRDMESIFALQSEIAEQIAKELKVKLSLSEIEQIKYQPTQNLEAYRLYLKGSIIGTLREKDFERTIYYLNRALELDSTYALAYAGLSKAYLSSIQNSLYPKKVEISEVKKLAMKALSINNDIAEAHITLAKISALHEWRWEEAEQELKLAISLDPNSVNAHLVYAFLLEILGKFQDAQKEIDLAKDLDPYSIAVFKSSTDLYMRNGQYDKALAEADKIKEIDRHHPSSYFKKFSLFIFQKKYSKAFEVQQERLQLNYPKSKKYIDAYTKAYNDSGIEGVFRQFIQLSSEEQDERKLINKAKWYAFLNENDKALTILEECCERRILQAPNSIRNSPYFINLRSEPRYQALLKKMGLDKYQ
ncbi:MAG: helix-turn-helix domain-containing protein [Bacteroidota bacterium]